MMLRCLVISCLLFAAESAYIKSRNIPVEIVYDKSNPLSYANRNLDAKIQLSPDDLLRLKLSDEIINAENEDVEAQVHEITEVNGNPYGVRNLDEKVQLSSDELSEAIKFLPNTVENEETKSVSLKENATPTQEAQPENNDLVSFLKKAEEIAYSGINSIKTNIDKASEAISNAKPNSETWEKLNQTLEGFFKEQYKRVNLKEDKPPENQNTNQPNEFFQNFMNNFQSTVNQFMVNFQQNGNKPQGSEDEQQGQQQNGFQSVMNFFANGFQQVVNNMNNLNGQNATSSGQEDTGIDSQGTNFFGSVFNQVTQFFGQGGNPAQAGNNQSDTGTQSPSNPGQFFQGAFQQVINNFRPSTSTKAPVQGDEGTASTTPSSAGGSNPIISGAQAIGGQFGQVIGGQGGSGGSNPIASGAEAIGGQFGQLVGQGSGGSNPIASGAQAIGGQFGQFVGQGNTNQSGSNPFVSGAQAIGGQFGQLAGGQGGGEQGSNPITSGAQAIGSQIGQLTGGQGGNNPFGSIQNVIGGASASPAASTEKTKIDINEKSEVMNESPMTTNSQENKHEEEKSAESQEKKE